MRKSNDDIDVHGGGSDDNTPPWVEHKRTVTSFVKDNWAFLLIGVVFGAVLAYNILK